MLADKIKLLIVSDSKLFLDGLRKILEYENIIEIAAETTSLKTLNTLIKDFHPEMLFVDNREFNCDIEKLMQTEAITNNNIKVILLTEGEAGRYDSPNLVNVNQDTTASELIGIIKNEKNEQRKTEHIEQQTEFHRITKTEFKIIKLIASGDTNKEISVKLSIAEKTVKAHISKIFEKLNVQNRYQLMLLGKRNKKNFEMNP